MSSLSARGTPRISSPKATFSSTVFHGKMAYSWNTTLLRGRRGSGPGTIRASPPERLSRPARMRRNVDLPQPDGPTKHTNSPSLIVRSKFTMAGTSPAIDGYSLFAARAITLSATATAGSLLVGAGGFQCEVGEVGGDDVAKVDGGVVLGAAVLAVHALDVGKTIDRDGEVGVVQHRCACADRFFGRVDEAEVSRDVLGVVVVIALHESRRFEERQCEAVGHFGPVVEELTGADEGYCHQARHQVGGQRDRVAVGLYLVGVGRTEEGCVDGAVLESRGHVGVGEVEGLDVTDRSEERRVGKGGGAR